MKSCHSFHSLEAEKGPMSFTFRHTHPGKVETKSPPREWMADGYVHRLETFLCLLASRAQSRPFLRPCHINVRRAGLRKSRRFIIPNCPESKGCVASHTSQFIVLEVGFFEPDRTLDPVSSKLDQPHNH